MKYIRLKNKIVKVDAEDSECYYFNKLKKFVYKDEGYKTADTIEELCDVFVIVKDSEGIEFWKNFKLLKNHSHHIIENDFDNIYGAIWTDKGLIYVAKLNKEGGFELL